MSTKPTAQDECAFCESASLGSKHPPLWKFCPNCGHELEEGFRKTHRFTEESERLEGLSDVVLHCAFLKENEKKKVATALRAYAASLRSNQS